MTVAELFAEERERFEREHPRSPSEVFDSLAARLGTLSG